MAWNVPFLGVVGNSASAPNNRLSGLAVFAFVIGLLYVSSASAQTMLYRGRIASEPILLASRTVPKVYTVGPMYQPQRFHRAATYIPSRQNNLTKSDEKIRLDLQLNNGRPIVSGNHAVLRNGIAYAPAAAPANVKRAIWAVNTLRRKPYRWGGGHRSFYDAGYDCSGAVSYALYHAGLLRRPLDSRGLTRWGDRGKGRWITVYSRRGHAFAVIAGLRLDTTGFNEREGPRWRAQLRSTRGFRARHYAGV
jgi:hypothetical protein